VTLTFLAVSYSAVTYRNSSLVFQSNRLVKSCQARTRAEMARGVALVSGPTSYGPQGVTDRGRRVNRGWGWGNL